MAVTAIAEKQQQPRRMRPRSWWATQRTRAFTPKNLPARRGHPSATRRSNAACGDLHANAAIRFRNPPNPPQKSTGRRHFTAAPPPHNPAPYHGLKILLGRRPAPRSRKALRWYRNSGRQLPQRWCSCLPHGARRTLARGEKVNLPRKLFAAHRRSSLISRPCASQAVFGRRSAPRLREGYTDRTLADHGT